MSEQRDVTWIYFSHAASNEAERERVQSEWTHVSWVYDAKTSSSKPSVLPGARTYVSLVYDAQARVTRQYINGVLVNTWLSYGPCHELWIVSPATGDEASRQEEV